MRWLTHRSSVARSVIFAAVALLARRSALVKRYERLSSHGIRRRMIDCRCDRSRAGAGGPLGDLEKFFLHDIKGGRVNILEQDSDAGEL